MSRIALLLTEEHGPGGVHTMLGQLQSCLSAQGWAVQTQSVRQGRPGLLTLLTLARHAQVIMASNNFRPAYWAVLLGLLAHRPSVVWVHGPLANVLQARPVSWPRRLWLRWTCRLADALVFASRTAQEGLHRVVPPQQLHLQAVIHNPAPEASPTLSSEAVACTSTDTEQMAPVALGFVGRLSPEKRPELLLHMLALLAPRYHLTLVGDGPLRPALEKLALQLGLNSAQNQTNRVHFAGEQKVTTKTYQSWQATVLCSAYEGYPLAALESLAAGVPVLGTPLPALQEMLQAQTPAWLAQDDSAPALAQVVHTALQAPRSRLREQALTIAAAHPSHAFAQGWQALLQRLTGESSCGPRTVHFVHAGPAYMPEMAAYEAHIAALGHRSQRHTSAASVPVGADVVWWLCGRVHATHAHRLRHSLQVHEYASASVGRWPALKDRIKRWLHPRPDHRLFLNDWVRQRMGFDDGVPYSLRDMGVPPHFLSAARQAAPEFDLVYLGEMGRLLAFADSLRAIHDAGLRLLLVGDVPPTLQTMLPAWPNIVCAGQVPQQEVPAWLLKARAGLNLMPERLPLSQQTSTKVLEYLAVGLPVLSNDYAWARQIASQHPEHVRLLNDTANSEVWREAYRWAADGQTPRCDLRALAWPAVLAGLPVWSALGMEGQA